MRNTPGEALCPSASQTRCREERRAAESP